MEHGQRILLVRRLAGAFELIEHQIRKDDKLTIKRQPSAIKAQQCTYLTDAEVCHPHIGFFAAANAKAQTAPTARNLHRGYYSARTCVCTPRFS